MEEAEEELVPLGRRHVFELTTENTEELEETISEHLNPGHDMDDVKEKETDETTNLVKVHKSESECEVHKNNHGHEENSMEDEKKKEFIVVDILEIEFEKTDENEKDNVEIFEKHEDTSLLLGFISATFEFEYDSPEISEFDDTDCEDDVDAEEIEEALE